MTPCASRSAPFWSRCNTFTESEVCSLCASPRRDASLLCVVESPGDLLMMEQSQSYAGLYFVLMGRLSPLDGIGPPAEFARRWLSGVPGLELGEALRVLPGTVWRSLAAVRR